jgi:replicative DNA helicase
MNINIIILNLFLNKELFNKYSRIISLEYYKQNNNTLFKIFLALFELHKASEDDITLDALALQVYTMYPRLKDEEKVLIEATLEQVSTADVDENLALAYLEKHNQQALSTEIAIKALDVSQGRAEFSVLHDLINTAEINVEGSGDDLFVSTDLEVLVNSEQGEEGLRWRLDTLNKMVGSLRKGDFGFVFARPETGKTTFLASEVMYMAQQANEKGLGPVLWCNNEEGKNKVMLRCYQGVFGISTQELYTNMIHYKEEFERLIGDKFKFYDNAALNKKDIDKIVKDLNPSLIVFDQIDKIYGFDGDRYDLKMKSIYIWARELAKAYCPVIGICQAGGTAEGKKYLSMTDVDSSHTAKQAECDLMIGIGATHNDGDEYTRYLSICKNKLTGDADTIPELRHGKIPVLIDPINARYKDIQQWK